VKADGDLSNHAPDFLVKTTDGAIWIVEIKGRAELDLPQKMARLKQWCADASAASGAEGRPNYRFVYADQKASRPARRTTLPGWWRHSRNTSLELDFP